LYISRPVLKNGVDCNDENFPENFQFCEEHLITETPEVLILRENKVFSYFTQKRDISDFDEKHLIEFLEELEGSNLQVKHQKNPKFNISSCCEVITVIADNDLEDGIGVLRKT